MRNVTATSRPYNRTRVKTLTLRRGPRDTHAVAAVRCCGGGSGDDGADGDVRDDAAGDATVASTSATCRRAKRYE